MWLSQRSNAWRVRSLQGKIQIKKESVTLNAKLNAVSENLSFLRWVCVQNKVTVIHELCRRKICFIGTFSASFSHERHGRKRLNWSQTSVLWKIRIGVPFCVWLLWNCDLPLCGARLPVFDASCIYLFRVLIGLLRRFRLLWLDKGTTFVSVLRRLSQKSFASHFRFRWWCSVFGFFPPFRIRTSLSWTCGQV